MIKLGISPLNFLLGGVIGLGLLYGLLKFWPDGKLHIVFCDVGQGDAIYLRLPNGADMLVDGGPNNQVLSCLGKHMPFYDRTIEIVALTHPQKDHLLGLIEVVKRYSVRYFVTVPVENTTESFQKLTQVVKTKKIPLKYPTTGTGIRLGETTIDILWPESKWLNQTLGIDVRQLNSVASRNVLGVTTDKDLNLFSLYLHLKYDDFDLLLTGDGDSDVQTLLQQWGIDQKLTDNLEVFKVPHHGSKTALNNTFLERLRPRISVIEVGKNSYGHPDEKIINYLSQWGKVYRTDVNGDIEINTDGKTMSVKTTK